MKDEIDRSALASIMHSKRANIYYLEYCRVLVNGGRVEYVTSAGKQSLYWNIPIANTTSVVLGTGTSITQAAMRELARAGVLVGFSGGGGTPLFSANEVDIEVAWFSPQSEYRPTEYLQRWVSFWFDDESRLKAAKQFQIMRLERVESAWLGTRTACPVNYGAQRSTIEEGLLTARGEILGAKNLMELLTIEARLTKKLYKWTAAATSYGEFKREKGGKGLDPANRFLDHGNYLAYGLATTGTWVLGIPHGLAVLHGKTRRGGLVFDVADLVKDAYVLPQAFASAVDGDGETQFRRSVIDTFAREEALDFMVDSLKNVAQRLGQAK